MLYNKPKTTIFPYQLDQKGENAMRTILVMFDSLNRRFLPNYGCTWVKAPNFERLGRRCVTFDNAYVGSMPCMPARREMHTGRYNFLHRSWGPMEPFDDSAPEILKKNGVYTHLASDHQHYWEDGGATLHPPFSFTKGVPVLQVPTRDPQGAMFPFYRYGTRLYDLQSDPGQLHPIEDQETELRMIHAMTRLMQENDAPSEQYERLGLPIDHEMTAEELKNQKAWIAANDRQVPVEGWSWTPEAKEQFLALAMFTEKETLPDKLREYLAAHPAEVIDCPVVEAFAMVITPEAAHGPVLNVLNVVARRS